MNRDVKEYDRDVFESSLQLGVKALHQLGFSNYQAHRLARTFRVHHQKVVEDLYHHYKVDEKKYLSEAKKHVSQLEKLLRTEKEETIHDADGSWDVTSLREEVREIYAEMDKDSDKK
jgi:hypothetical protein